MMVAVEAALVTVEGPSSGVRKTPADVEVAKDNDDGVDVATWDGGCWAEPAIGTALTSGAAARREYSAMGTMWPLVKWGWRVRVRPQNTTLVSSERKGIVAQTVFHESGDEGQVARELGVGSEV